MRTAPFVLIESQALLLERQAAIGEQAPNLGSVSSIMRLVEYAMHTAGQDRIDVCHQIDIVAVVAAEIREVVGEVLTAGEMLLECREAAAERMPSRVDDLRVRQDQMDEPDVRRNCWASCR